MQPSDSALFVPFLFHTVQHLYLLPFSNEKYHQSVRVHTLTTQITSKGATETNTHTYQADDDADYEDAVDININVATVCRVGVFLPAVFV